MPRARCSESSAEGKCSFMKSPFPHEGVCINSHRCIYASIVTHVYEYIYIYTCMYCVLIHLFDCLWLWYIYIYMFYTCMCVYIYTHTYQTLASGSPGPRREVPVNKISARQHTLRVERLPCNSIFSPRKGSFKDGWRPKTVRRE